MSKLFYNGTILTMDDTYPQTEAVLIRDGKIVKRGLKEEVFVCKTADTECIDLKGKTMMPGFIDSHSHFSGLASSLLQCDLSKASCFQDIIDMMKAYIRDYKIPAGQWVTGTNYDHNFLKEKQHPDKNVLNQISVSHPIVIIHASSHMGAANSLGLQALGLENEIADPPGGRYGRMQENGELSGYMEENAFVDFRNRMPGPDINDMLEQFKKAQNIYASYGITTVQEGMVTELLLPILQMAAQKEVLYLDLVGYMDLNGFLEADKGESLHQAYEEFGNHYVDHLKLGGCKIFLDGSPQGRTAWMKEPYEQAEDGYCGYPIKKDQELYDLIVSALKDQKQVLAHCNGDAAAEQYITQFEKVKKDYPEYNTCRPVMIHAQLVTEGQLERMRDLSMIPSFFIAHTYYWGDIHIENFGWKRASYISPAGTAQRLGLSFTLHQDSPVLPPDVFQTIWCAGVRMTKEGRKLAQEECISVYDGLKAMTVYGAYQYFEEDKKGTIEEGKLADLIILDKNPLQVSVDKVKEIQVLETIKEGKTIYVK